MKKILFAGLLAGVLDTIAAIILYAKPVNLHIVASLDGCRVSDSKQSKC